MAAVEEKTSPFNDIRWKSISLTHVEYPAGDACGLVLAWSSLLPIFILIGFATLIISRRDMHTICYCLGMVLNEICNLVLKHLIKESRPMKRDTLHTEYGMPSSHSQFMWFFVCYLILFIFIRVHNNYNTIDNVWKYVACVLGVCAAVCVSYSRVYLGYHTGSQVLWGCLIGLCLGLLYFLLVQLVFTPFFPIITAWPVSEFLMLRDCTLIPNLLWFEYTSARSEGRSRQRKITSRKSQ